MTQYNDLTYFEYSDSEWALNKGFPYILLNVGWIGDNIINNGPPLNADEKKSLIYHLEEFLKYPVNLYMGIHTCTICGFRGSMKTEIKQGNGEIFIKGINNVVYVAPTMILHYVDAHDYVPPSGFINAVRGVTSMNHYRMFYDIYENEIGWRKYINRETYIQKFIRWFKK